jgi:hypothetical protein
MQALRIKLNLSYSQLNRAQTDEEVKRAANHIWYNTIFSFVLALIALGCAIWLIATEEDNV